jgi:hypothetical protein
MEGGRRSRFVTNGIESALEQLGARRRGRTWLWPVARRRPSYYLTAELVTRWRSASADAAGRGERLFEGCHDLHGLRLVRTVAAADVTHLKFAR